eukprot:bmy_16022T0
MASCLDFSRLGTSEKLPCRSPGPHFSSMSPTAPSVSGASPPGPVPSSAAPRLCRACGGAWAVEPTVARAGLPEHAPVLFMPHLDPFLPLVLVKFVLFQDPGKTMHESQLIWPELVFLKVAVEEILKQQKIMNAYTRGTGVGWGGGGSVRYKKMAASHNFFEA